MSQGFESIESSKIGKLHKEYNYCRTGEHVSAGLMIATGPGIPAGRLSRRYPVLDFAPTFCEALGVATMASMAPAFQDYRTRQKQIALWPVTRN